MRLIISIILLLAAVLVLFMWARPLWTDILDVRVGKGAYESALTRLNHLRKTRDSLLTSYNSIPTPDLRRIKSFLPPNINSGSLVVQSADMAGQNGLSLENINISSADERTGEVAITLSVSGGYPNFVSFLRSIESSLRLMDVSTISFSSAPGNIYSFNLEAKIYTQ